MDENAHNDRYKEVLTSIIDLNKEFIKVKFANDIDKQLDIFDIKERLSQNIDYAINIIQSR